VGRREGGGGILLGNSIFHLCGQEREGGGVSGGKGGEDEGALLSSFVFINTEGREGKREKKMGGEKRKGGREVMSSSQCDLKRKGRKGHGEEGKKRGDVMMLCFVRPGVFSTANERGGRRRVPKGGGEGGEGESGEFLLLVSLFLSPFWPRSGKGGGKGRGEGVEVCGHPSFLFERGKGEQKRGGIGASLPGAV